MPNKHGDFIWYELMTPDADASQDFYGKIVNWSFDKRSDMDYTMLAGEDGGVGGFMQLTEEMTAHGARPAWLGYIRVDDVDSSAKSIAGAGGSVYREPWNIEGVGRMAQVADPQGAVFYIMKGEADEKSPAFADTDPKDGHCAWNELATSDPEAAIGFYTDQFGWEKDDVMDMGEMGKYHMLRHDFMVGGVMKRPDEMPVSAWAYYFRVPEIDAAAKAIKEHGGEIVMGPMEIPGGEHVINAVDPQGAMFALIGPKK